MSPGQRFLWLFGLVFLVLPLPLLGPFHALVPPVRSAILLAATAALAIAEGASGPVPGILALFAVNLLGGTALAAGLAYALARALAHLSPAAQRASVWLVWALALALALGLEPYVTPFGRAPTANLLGVLS